MSLLDFFKDNKTKPIKNIDNTKESDEFVFENVLNECISGGKSNLWTRKFDDKSRVTIVRFLTYYTKLRIRAWFNELNDIEPYVNIFAAAIDRGVDVVIYVSPKQKAESTAIKNLIKSGNIIIKPCTWRHFMISFDERNLITCFEKEENKVWYMINTDHGDGATISHQCEAEENFAHFKQYFQDFRFRDISQIEAQAVYNTLSDKDTEMLPHYPKNDNWCIGVFEKNNLETPVGFVTCEENDKSVSTFMAVVPDYQNKGFGKALLDIHLERAAANKMSVNYCCRKDNTASVALVKSFDGDFVESFENDGKEWNRYKWEWTLR